MIIYACTLDKLGLPTEGLNWNGDCLDNIYERAEYVKALSDEQLDIFLRHIYKLGYEDGFDEGTIEVLSHEDEEE